MKIEDLDVGPPGPGEARVRIQAIGLNRSEAIFRQGQYIQPPSLPTLIGVEGAGVIEALGDGVQGFEVGQRVSVMPRFRPGQYGTYAEQAIVPAESLIRAPDSLPPAEAASVWMAYLTAWGLIEVGKAGVGDHVLIPAASSSVGLAAIQICNWSGAVPIAVTRTRDKAKALLAQGAAHVIASGEQDLPAETMRITGGKGARLVFDPVGGPYVETLAQAMSERGILFIYGSLSNQPTPYPHWTAAFRGLSLRGWVASEIWNHPERFEPARDAILTGLAAGKLKPVIDRTFTLDQIVEAHRYLESNQQVGKVVVTT
jgi:NADPH:quinone reductase-like Zn-dependent oxidoreductase